MNHLKLFEPYTINGKLKLQNRIIMPALVTRLATEEGHVTGALLERYLLYARGGTGLIVTEAISVKKQKSGQLLRLSDDGYISELRELTKRVHDETGAKIAPQLIHFLKISKSGYRQKVEDLSLEEVRDIPGLFAQAAARSRTAGFDAVELHFAHAYTMASFLSRHNHRKDEYGGKLKNRLRLAEEVVGAARGALGEDFVLGVRMNGDEFTLGGNTLEHARPIALRLAELGVDYISISAGGKFEDALPREGEPLVPYTGYSGHRTMPPLWMPEKVNVYLAADIRNTLLEAGFLTPVAAAGRIPNAHVAESLLRKDEADLVAVGRPTLCDPFWPNKTREGRDQEILKCIYCNRCKDADEAFRKVYCAQWVREDGNIVPPKP
jgi:2,4-dienoyl-CoA reductase-like NADH-dependent reductase (Old Yellow Enzyme family)